MTKSYDILARSNIFFLIGLALSIPASKAGMNLFLYPYVLTAFALYFKSDIQLRQSQTIILKSSVAVFVLGLIFSMFSKGVAADPLVYIQKYIYLLLPICLIFTATKNAKAIWWSLAAFIISIVACIFIDLYLFAFVYDFFSEQTVRLWGRIGYSRWPIVLTTGITAAVIYVFYSKNITKTIYALSFITLSVVAAILSGSKGGIVAIGILFLGFSTIIIKSNWKYIAVVFLITIAVFQTDTFQTTIVERGFSPESIKGESIQARVTMIKTAWSLSKLNASNDLQYLLFGGGLDKPQQAFEQALSSLPVEERETLTYGGRYWGHTDLHNSYLDQLFKSGLLFSLIYTSLMVMLVVFGYQAAKACNHHFKHCSFMFVTTILAYILFNSFYSNFADYAVYSQIYFLSLILCLPVVLGKVNKPLE
ncbi:O-antigen ligase family protein [Vibrio hangzhouensis]|uniref:O-antigen ligase like membrane protein n=1 Tax=Vibrio hangzhouensis TaxID=462991 RepID=A0A1H6CC27_9VIBR|nr:O-antigen ligase family protein [Vibrio hangzhouensis]SEG69936.1 O-antigen ligase like membrane protein [Vibrio hangzhouensis]